MHMPMQGKYVTGVSHWRRTSRGKAFPLLDWIKGGEHEVRRYDYGCGRGMYDEMYDLREEQKNQGSHADKGEIKWKE